MAKKDDASKIKQRKAIIGLVGVALSVSGMVYVFQDIKVDDLISSAGRIKILPSLAAIALYWVGLATVRACLIRHLLKPVGKVKLSTAYRYIGIGFLTNNILPFKAGEVPRSIGIARKAKLPYPSVFGGLAVERLLDVAMLAIVGLAAIQIAPNLPEAVQGVRDMTLIFAAVFAVAFLVLVVVARQKFDQPQASPKNLKDRIKSLIIRFSSGFAALGNFRSLVTAVALSMGLWIFALSAMAMRLVAFDFEPSLMMALVVLASTGFSVTMPSTPAALGVYHASVAIGLKWAGVDPVLAATFAIFCHVMEVVPSSLVGAVSLVLEGVGWSDLKTQVKLDKKSIG